MTNPKNAKKFKVLTLGCRTNQYESQAYQDQLLAMGYEAATEGEEAEVCIVNTCTVTESADSSSRHEIRRLARENPNSKLVVTGCYAERNPEAVKAIDGVTDVISNKNKENLLKIVFPSLDFPEFSIKNFEAHTRAFIKVQDGCNSFCTYCIIPYVRGRSRSRTLDEIVKEAKELIANGYKEIVLTGINIGDFDGAKSDNPDRLADLVRAIDAMPGLERLRISSIDPDEVDEDLLDAVINGKKTCHSMHIVLQAGSNVVLKRMNRKYTRQVFLNTINNLKAASKSFTFTTDIIVGFPGETEEDFLETLEVMKEVKFAKIHMFPFSARERTKANLMPNKVPVDVIKERKQKLLRLSEEMSFALRQEYVNKKMWVLTESIDSHQAEFITGHTDNFLPVYIPKEGLVPNMLVEVELIDNKPFGLVGRLC